MSRMHNRVKSAFMCPDCQTHTYYSFFWGTHVCPKCNQIFKDIEFIPSRFPIGINRIDDNNKKEIE